MIEIKTSSKENRSVLAISGRLNISSVRELESDFKNEIRKKPESIEINFAKTTYIDSSGIGSIIRCMNWAKKSQISFICSEPSKEVMSIFKIAKLDSYLNIIN